MLTDEFLRRGVALLEIAPGVSTPLRFSDSRQEHLATRRAAGLFDFSFMTCFEITGPGSLEYLHRLQTRNLQAVPPGKIVYTLLCREDGSVFNDATVWCHGPGHYWLFTGRRDDRIHVEEIAAAYDVTVRDCSGNHSVIAVQGYNSTSILQRCFPGKEWATLGYFGFRRAQFEGAACWVARIGYSGERGYEFVTEAAIAPALWNELLAAGRELGLAECGFEAANSLRIEAGHILFTRELAGPVTPYELGLDRLLSDYGVGYIGSDALRSARWTPPQRRLVGLLPAMSAEEVRSFEQLDSVARKELEHVRPGVACVTSASMSPLFGRPLALGFAAYDDRYPGTRVRLTTGHGAEVARLPFYDPGKILPRETRRYRH